MRGWGMLILLTAAACGGSERETSDRWLVEESESGSEAETPPMDQTAEEPQPEIGGDGTGAPSAEPSEPGIDSETEAEPAGPRRISSASDDDEGGTTTRVRAACVEPSTEPVRPPRRVRGNVAVVWHGLLDPEEPESGMLELDSQLEAQRSAERWVNELSLSPITRCYDAALGRDRTLSGGMGVQLVRRDEETHVEVLFSGLSDERLVACAERALTQGPRLPDSPFRVLLGFCPRHRAACFVGPQPRRQAAAHGDGLRTMLEGAEPALSACVAERAAESESPAGGVAVHFATGRGLVSAVGSDDQNGIGVSRELRSEVFRCAAAALSRLCAPNEADDRSRRNVQIMVHGTRR